jgi:hypothetical protein
MDGKRISPIEDHISQGWGLIEAGGFLRMGSGWDDDGSIKIANGIE